ncbi:hypothetical protein TorRG33x02_320200, partial [Trema orientale]
KKKMEGSSSSSSSSPSKPSVVLSFCDEDSGKGFISHLKYALSKEGIDSFTHEDGEELTEESRCSIIIFSPNYASSASRLDEIVKILDYKDTKGLIVIPVFYGVDPTDVRKLTGTFGRAFAKHAQDPRAPRWKETLAQVTNIAGKHLLNGDEAEFIRKIVAVLSSKLTSIRTSTSTSVASADIYEACFGLNSSVARLHSYLSTWLAGLRNICFAFFFFSRGFNQSQILIAAARV